MLIHKIIAALQWQYFRVSPQEYLRLIKKASDLRDLNHLSYYVNSNYLRRFLEENPMWWKSTCMELSWLQKNGFKTCSFGDPLYPESFYQLKVPPLIFSYTGTPVWKTHKCLSVIGSRAPSEEGRYWTQTVLRSYLEEEMNVCVVSGGAMGMDQLAHQQALLSRTPTLAFLPSGFRDIYPRRFQSWVSRIVEGGGAVVSQFSPSQSMRKHLFLIRNELIAAISKSTLMVEGRRRSGSHMTAKLAVDFGRRVATLPVGTRHPAQANNDMIFSGAIMVRDQLDLKELLK